MFIGHLKFKYHIAYFRNISEGDLGLCRRRSSRVWNFDGTRKTARGGNRDVFLHSRFDSAVLCGEIRGHYGPGNLSFQSNTGIKRKKKLIENKGFFSSSI